MRDKHELNEAVTAYRRALQIQPRYPEVLNNLGHCLHALGGLDEAVPAFRQALALKPASPEICNNLGNVLNDQGRLDEALAAYRQALAIAPSLAVAHGNLGNALMEKDCLDEAVSAYRQAIALDPRYAEAHSNLGLALKFKGDLDQAITAFRAARALNPDLPAAHCNLANALKDMGLLDDALAAYHQPLVLDPDFLEAHSALIFALNYHPDTTPQSLLEEALRWDLRFAVPLRQYILPHSNERDPDRRLRIGYVSPDLRVHVVAQALLPLLTAHDHRAFEIFCYAQVPHPDAMTERIAAQAHHWRSIVGLSDQQVAELVRQDQIDILVDLSGHSAGHRLRVFARRPAPVQITWLGYPGSTGLHTMDYRITTPVLDPPGVSEAWYTEQNLRLPETAWCYEPGNQTPEVVPPPALTTGRITFGCLNNFCKVSRQTLAVWIQILRLVPNSDLLLYAHEGQHRQRLRERLVCEGLGPERLRFVGRGGDRYFDFYQQIDIVLDPWPFTGSTTTCDALWMGVPVVSRDGPLVVSRLSLAVLSTVGLSEWVAHTPEDYVRIAVEMAGDLPRLSELRFALRQRMRTSPMMDAPRFARNMAAAYREMWRKWCMTNSPTGASPQAGVKQNPVGRQ